MDASVFPSTDAELLAWSRGMAHRLAGGSHEMPAALAGAFVAVNARFEAARAAEVREPESREARHEVRDARASMQAVARAIVKATHPDASATIVRVAA